MTDAPLDLDTLTDAGRAYAPDHAWNLMLAEIRRLRAELDRMRERWHAAVEMGVEADKTIARLTAPPGASAMSRSAIGYGFVTMPDPVTLHSRQMEIIEGCARAIEQAEAAARAQALEDAAKIVEGVPYRTAYRTWPLLGRGNESNHAPVTLHSDALAAAIRATAAKPQP